MRKLLLRSFFLLLLTGVIGGMVVPRSALQFVLRHSASIRHAVDFLDTVGRGADLGHLISFAPLGFAAHLGWRRWRAWHVSMGALLVASLVELVQVWIPGRVPAISHVVLDVLGALVGFGLAWLLTYAWGSESLPDYQHSTRWVGRNSDD